MSGDDLTGLVDTPRLTAWLDANSPALGTGPLTVAKIHGGTSNVILSLDRGSGPMILRRPPVVPPPGSEKSILRGWAAELRDGKIYNRAPFDTAPLEAGIAYAMVDGLIALAKVDFKAVGLADFGHPENYLERQVDRWERQIKSYKALYDHDWRELPGYAVARDWLRSNIPDDFTPGIIHGDVGTPNALFAFDQPARLTALIDWELSTIGDPLIDLAWFTNKMRDEEAPDRIDPDALYPIANFPTRQQLARHYATGTGRDLANFDYYCVLALFKGGCILEYKIAQAAAGILSAETGRFFDRLVRGNFARAEELVRRIS